MSRSLPRSSNPESLIASRSSHSLESPGCHRLSKTRTTARLLELTSSGANGTTLEAAALSILASDMSNLSYERGWNWIVASPRSKKIRVYT
jgi:hypothetical protein